MRNSILVITIDHVDDEIADLVYNKFLGNPTIRQGVSVHRDFEEDIITVTVDPALINATGWLNRLLTWIVWIGSRKAWNGVYGTKMERIIL